MSKRNKGKFVRSWLYPLLACARCKLARWSCGGRSCVSSTALSSAHGFGLLLARLALVAHSEAWLRYWSSAIAFLAFHGELELPAAAMHLSRVPLCFVARLVRASLVRWLASALGCVCLLRCCLLAHFSSLLLLLWS